MIEEKNEEKEEEENVPELIFYCEYNPNDFEDRLEISFTNKYDIKLDFFCDEETKKNCINVDLQSKESNIPKDFFGKNILNVTAIAGKNGVGKTNVFNRLYTKQGKQVNFFTIYTIKNSLILELSVNKSAFKQIFNIIRNGKIEDPRVIYNIPNEETVKCVQGFWGLRTERLDRNIGYDFNPIRTFTIQVKTSNIYLLLCDKQFRKRFQFSQHTNYLQVTADIDAIGVRLNTSYCALALLLILLRNFTCKVAQNYRDTEDIPRNERPRKQMVEPGIVDFDLSEDFHYGTEYFNEEGYLEEYVERLKKLESMMNNNQSHEFLAQSLLHILDFLEENFNKYQKFISSERYKVFVWELEKLIGCAPELLRINFYDSIRCENRLSVSDNQFMLIFSTKFSNDTFSLIESIESLDSNLFGIYFEFGKYSSGEEFVLKQIAAIYQFILNNSKNCRSLILYLDEYEIHLHPEWSRQYLSYLLKFLDIEGERLGIKFQLILTTHSPYLISDLPKENIILLEKDEKTGKRTTRKSNYGFASNYYDIMNDSFFLDDTIGEFAKQKINNCIQAINHISDDLDKLANKELILNGDELFLFVKESLENIEGQKQIINIVGDDVIRKQLWNMSDVVEQRLLESDESRNNKERLRKRRSELAKQMAQIDQELESYD